MTITETPHGYLPTPDSAAGGRTAWPTLLTVVCAVVVVLLLFVDEYGYHADELYFRLLGQHGPAWGYTDQPPLLPLVVEVATSIFGDSLLGIRLPAILCAAAVVVLGTLIAVEFGASRRAQLLTAVGLGTSMLVLTFGHWILTSSFDTVAWCAAMLFTLRALRRDDGRWWIPAGVVVGLALYAKLIVLLLPVTVLLGLLLVGPRHHLRQRWIYLAALAALVIGAPNIVYQVANDFPQLQMADALGETDGAVNRQMFLQNLIFLLGPGLVPIWIAGLVGTFRDPHWRPVRAFGLAYLIATVAALVIDGGRPDYTAGFLVALFALGAIRTDRWIARRPRRRMTVVSVALVLTGALQGLLALPVVPADKLHRFAINSMALETVGWPATVAQITEVYLELPVADRNRAVLLVENFGEAGALDRYGEDLPPVFSGHNELHRWGPPPPDADVVIAVGIDPDRLQADFESCRVVTRLDNGLKVENPEQGKEVALCRHPRAAWSALWPSYRHLNAYL